MCTGDILVEVVINLAKIKILKQFTTRTWDTIKNRCCYQSCKDKNFKAIHNKYLSIYSIKSVVINLAKIKILKQFTTIDRIYRQAMTLLSILQR